MCSQTLLIWSKKPFLFTLGAETFVKSFINLQILFMKVHPEYCNAPSKKVRRSFTVFISLILSHQKTGEQEFQLNSFIILGSYLFFSVKAKVYLDKFQQTIAKILPLNFFPYKIFFTKIYLLVLGRCLVSFSWIKMFAFQLMPK